MNNTKTYRVISAPTLALLALLFFSATTITAAQGDLDLTFGNGGKVISGGGFHAASAQTIQVGNIEELYSAVNDPVNWGATLNLAPGVYMLSATDAFGTARPNGGRLELQENMSLMGVSGDRSAVVIDANNLPASSYTVPGFTGRVAGVRIGRGRNSIEWLTVRNARFGTSNIDTTLLSPGTAFVTVAHIASSGSQRGVDLINHAQLGASGRTIEADVVDNDLFNNTLGTIAQGMRAE